MNQRALYKTIESFASEHFKSEVELLKHVVNEMVKSDQINIKGGRIWLYSPTLEGYYLLHQIGAIERIEQDYQLLLTKYPIFTKIGEHRSVIANETDKYLREKGIRKFYALGVGEFLPYKNKTVYQYILAFNSDLVEQAMLPDLNIISLAVTSVLRGKRSERKALELERDIDKAREIQMGILPPSDYRFGKYNIYGTVVPARIVGGDFFDYIRLDSEGDRLGIIVADAASKGFRAASQALFVAGAMRMGTAYNLKIHTLMTQVNKLIHRTFSEEQFVTMFYAEFLDVTKGLVLYANAGQTSPILYHARDRTVELLESTGQMLGPFPNGRYKVENANMLENDVLVMYTDGISEQPNIEEALYGEQRLIQTIERSAGATAKEICAAIFEDVARHAGDCETRDDQTIVVVKRLP